MYSQNDELASQGFTGGITPYPAPSQYDSSTYTLGQSQNLPVQSQGQVQPNSQPFVASQGQPGPYPPQQYAPPSPYQQSKQSLGNCCKTKFMKYFVIFSVYFVAAVLVGLVGIMCPWLLIYNKIPQMVPHLLFSVYCLIFGILLVVIEFRVKIIVNFFPFIASFFHRAFFIMFLGTLSMGAYEILEKFQWVGYVVGGVVMFIGVVHIAVGCSDPDWRKQQNAKYYTTWFKSVPEQPGINADSGQSKLDQFYGEPSPAQYPSLATDTSLYAANQQPQQQQQQQVADPRRQMALEAAKMKETQTLAAVAGQATVVGMISGQSAEQAALNAFSDPKVQSLALNATVAAAQNPQIQAAAASATSNALSNAYDRLFED